MTEQEFIKKAELAHIESIQLTRIITEEDSVKYVNENREKYNISKSILYLINASQKKKTVKVKTNYLDDEIIKTILMKFRYIESTNENTYLENREDNNEPEPKVILDITKVFPKIEETVKKIKNDVITKIEIEYREQYQQIQILNNKGVNLNTSSHNYILDIETAAHKEEKDVVTKKLINQTTDNFDFKKILESEIEEAENRLKEVVLKTGKYKVLLQNKVAGSIIESIMEGLNKEQIQKSGSIYQDRLNQKVASSILNIIEDPTNKSYPGYALFDMEGTKTKKKEVITNGILKTYFYNNQTAKKDEVASTGNEYGGITTSNLYVIPGEKTREDLIKELDCGIVVTSFMCGQESISLEKGNISLQVFGYFIENGKIKGGIKPAILTTTFDELLNNLAGIGNDLLFRNRHTGSPSLLFNELSIASE